jgi:hypothetical protein
MQARTKIRFDAIEQARRLLENAPPPETEEVTKSHAIRLLLPQIREAQSRGYSIEAITRMLSESGVQVSAHLVKDLVWRLGTRRASQRDPGKRSARRRTASSPERGDPSRQATPSNEPSTKANAGSATKTTLTDNGEQVPRDDATPRDPSLQPSAASSPRRSSLLPRPDTKDS